MTYKLENLNYPILVLPFNVKKLISRTSVNRTETLDNIFDTYPDLDLRFDIRGKDQYWLVDSYKRNTFYEDRLKVLKDIQTNFLFDKPKIQVVSYDLMWTPKDVFESYKLYRKMEYTGVRCISPYDRYELDDDKNVMIIGGF